MELPNEHLEMAFFRELLIFMFNCEEEINNRETN